MSAQRKFGVVGGDRKCRDKTGDKARVYKKKECYFEKADEVTGDRKCRN